MRTSSASRRTGSFMELKGARDLELVDRIYADHDCSVETLSTPAEPTQQEFNMTSDASTSCRARSSE